MSLDQPKSFTLSHRPSYPSFFSNRFPNYIIKRGWVWPGSLVQLPFSSPRTDFRHSVKHVNHEAWHLRIHLEGFMLEVQGIHKHPYHACMCSFPTFAFNPIMVMRGSYWHIFLQDPNINSVFLTCNRTKPVLSEGFHESTQYGTYNQRHMDTPFAGWWFQSTYQ